jgi:hypothetical protein
MANYRRNFLAAGSYFFTVNLADRLLMLLNDHIDLLWAAFLRVPARHPFRDRSGRGLAEPSECDLDPSQSKTRILPCVGA